jgi:isoquinoline 1-oxidoreductase beta subunit
MTTRREFVQWTAAAGAALTVGQDKGEDVKDVATVVQQAPAAFRPSPWLRIHADGQVVLTVGKSEMGQGVRTALPMILAEELGVDLESVQLEQASPGPEFPSLGTGGSQSVRRLYATLRQAGAQARVALVNCASARWKVDAGQCKVASGTVQGPKGQKLAFGELVQDAMAMAPVKDAPLKDPSTFRIVGKDRNRLDGPDLVTGKAQFGSDVRLPGMRFATVVRCPVFGGKVRAFDAKAALGVPGVLKVLEISTGVAIVAEHVWAALSARELLQVTWESGPHGAFDSAAQDRALEAALARKEPPHHHAGDAAAALSEAKRPIRASYTFPCQAHATLEPMNATARVKEGRADVWCGTQTPNDAQKDVAKKLGFPVDHVAIHVMLLGGGFGRRLATDFAVEAAELAKAIDEPVQVLWSRQDDMQQDHYHPASRHALAGAVDEKGQLQVWSHTVAAPSLLRSWTKGRSAQNAGTELLGAAHLPYRVPNQHVAYHEVENHLPLGWWRAIQFVPNIFAMECFMDELARTADQDPMAFRLAHLEPKSGLAGVLRLVKEASHWPAKKRDAGRGIGLACMDYEGTQVAEVAEVTVRKGILQIHRLTVAVDCGLVINPLGLKGQIESGVAWGLSALRTAITFQEGRVVQGTYKEFPILRMEGMPEVAVHVVPSTAAPRGIGEPPVPPVIPAVLNAIFDATGVRIRTLPLGEKIG